MVLVMKKKLLLHKKRGNNTKQQIDRISQLPDCLLHQIFSFLDTTDVVKTCILSKRWRYLWASSPYLNFTSDGCISLLKRSLTNFITQLLLRRKSIPINSFIYEVCFNVDAALVESLICYAVKHQVRNLTLEPYCVMSIQFPFYFDGCASLTTLKLDASNYESRPLPKTLELPSLKNLHLIGFESSDGSIFSSLPNLETLKLQDICFEGVQNFCVCALNLKSFDFENIPEEEHFSRCEFVITAPKLRKFKFDGYPPFVRSIENLCPVDQIEIDLPSKWELDSINFTIEQKKEFAGEALQMINSFHTAKSITLSMSAIWVLSHVPSLLNERPSQFPNLKSLKVKCHNYSKNNKIPSFILDHFIKDHSLLEILGNGCKLSTLLGLYTNH